MADGGRYRRRRHARLRRAAGRARSTRGRTSRTTRAATTITLNGGIERWFEPVTQEIGDGASDAHDPGTLPRAVRAAWRPTRDWHIEVHQFRIEARRGEQGKPTPEGMHRDGVDYVLVLLVDRRNIAQRHHDDPRPRMSATWAASR